MLKIDLLKIIIYIYHPTSLKSKLASPFMSLLSQALQGLSSSHSEIELKFLAQSWLIKLNMPKQASLK